jgi:ribosomal protein S12 methylthiotransferase
MLLERLAGVIPEQSSSEDTEIAWLRLLYGHPESIQDATIKTMARHRAICSYYDIPIQHASRRVLKRMGRNYTPVDLYRLYERIRELDPDSALRTTVIVGFPGETDKDFNELFDFVKAIRFDHLGVFIYSDFEDLPSHHLPDPVPETVAQSRHDELMSLQADISRDINRKHLGKVYTVLAEEHPEKGVFIGRTAFQAPEVDGITFIRSEDMRIGHFIDVKIEDTLEYDLMGVPA